MTADGVHTLDLGHLAMAKAVAAALLSKITKTRGSRVVNPDVNKLANGTMAGGTATT